MGGLETGGGEKAGGDHGSFLVNKDKISIQRARYILTSDFGRRRRTATQWGIHYYTHVAPDPILCYLLVCFGPMARTAAVSQYQ